MAFYVASNLCFRALKCNAFMCFRKCGRTLKYSNVSIVISEKEYSFTSSIQTNYQNHRALFENIFKHVQVNCYNSCNFFRRSCNDIKVHGVMAGREYTDGYYMINPAKPANYLPVFCDMTSDEGAFTLLVTSANGNWTRNEVPLRY